jgi:cobalt/nickel transport system permease protein
MGIVLPFLAYGVYRMVAGASPLTSRRRVAAAAVGGYVGLAGSALCCGIEMGLQPMLFHDAAGVPLYSPYHLSQAVPAMLLSSLVLAGVVEALLTAGVLAYLQRANVPLLRINHPKVPLCAGMSVRTRRQVRPIRLAMTAMALMVLLTPLGLLAPGGAFGEDAPADLDLKSHGLDAVPSGLLKWSGFWHHTLLDGYGFSSGSNPNLAYLVSAVLGVAVTGTAIYVVAVLIRFTRRAPAAPSEMADALS